MIRRRHIHFYVTDLFARGFFLGALLNLFLFASTTSQAHGPFDNSIHATLRTDALEVSVVMGGEAAREILNRAAPNNTVSLGGMGLKTQPNELAAFFIEIKSSATSLAANLFTVVGDDRESRRRVRQTGKSQRPITNHRVTHRRRGQRNQTHQRLACLRR